VSPARGQASPSPPFFLGLTLPPFPTAVCLGELDAVRPPSSWHAALHVDAASLRLSAALPGPVPPLLRRRFLTCHKNSRLVAWGGKRHFGWSRGGEKLPATRGLDLLCQGRGILPGRAGQCGPLERGVVACHEGRELLKCPWDQPWPHQHLLCSCRGELG